ncbi:hypothetical protein ACNPM2_12855 [Stenotrophomonas geniculata]|jgi:hypothetical protein|uniref:Uncharacterized protein n=1 Tax=Stenotrophomonas geniculata TaxID=86188 RepID=A0ABW1N4B3_9GAMM|nr:MULTISPECIES: hypothetical protein [Stenotrophomonas]MCU1016022.1 hypothetical protein [Stenotrophomonas maltophilia]MDH1196078.1 hypothetical protein [Stenotrophomonas sp. GD03958]MDT3558293.1 hypothetical protein [Stenotrophomonas maltophilia group sp. msm1]
MSWLFLLSILGIIIFYPAYFYFLHEFKVRLERDHPELSRRKRPGVSLEFEGAYQRLRAVNRGRLDGVILSKSVCDSHRLASRFLYLGMTSFMVLLMLGLYDSVWGGGKR